jgi:voltage-gated potassium channel Kch
MYAGTLDLHEVIVFLAAAGIVVPLIHRLGVGPVLGFLAVGLVIGHGLARLFGRPRAVALESALLLGQGGEFSFLVVGLALSLGLMPKDTAQFMLIVTGLTMVATPLVARGARRLAERVEAHEASGRRADVDLLANFGGHVIVAGYGRVGQMLGSVLDEQGLPHVGIDTDTDLVSLFRHKGAGVFFGDARRPEMLRRVAIEHALALVVTMDSPRAAERVVEAAHRNWPDLPIYARARDVAHATRLLAQGATHVIPETIEASLQLSEMVLIGAGVPGDAARHLIDLRRQAEQMMLDESR